MGIAGIAVTVLSVVWPVAAAQEKHEPIGCWKGDEADPPPGNVAADATGAHPGVYRNGASTGPRPAPAPAFSFPNERCMTFAGPQAGVGGAARAGGGETSPPGSWVGTRGGYRAGRRRASGWCARQDLNLQPSGS